MKVSVIIPTKNRVNQLNKCLSSIEGQTLLPYEIIIVNASSSNKTKLLLRKFPKLKIKCFKSNIASLTYQRNLGVEKSTGEIVQFLDDDIEIKNDYLEQIAKVFTRDRKRQIAGVGGKIISKSPAKNAPSFFAKKFLRLFFLESPAGEINPSVKIKHLQETNFKKPATTKFLCGCAAYRREIFGKYRFDEKLAGYAFLEDVDFSFRVAEQYQLFLTPKAIAYHKGSFGNLSIEKYKQETITNRFYFFKKHIPQTTKNKLVFSLSIVGELTVAGKRLVINRDIGYFKGVVAAIKNIVA